MIEELDNHAKRNGFRLNPNERIVDNVIKGLKENERKYGKRYCPCRRIRSDDTVCPCVFHKDEIKKMGHCTCFLFVK